MLQAKMENGKLLVIAQLTKAEIARLKKEKKKFFCPVCQQPVMMKAGSQVIPHFAHLSLDNCPSQAGGEGTYHQRGKLLLYYWLRSQHIDVALEKYLPEIQQQPDLLIHLNGRRIAIEYQCARLPKEDIHLRNEGYREAGIIPIWFIGANRLRRQTAVHFKLDQMTLQLTHQYSPTYPKVIYYFCPYTIQLIRLYDVYITKRTQGIAKMKIDKLHAIRLNDLFYPEFFPQDELFHLWKKEKKYFRTQPRKRAYGTELAWRQYVYAKGSHIEYLPSLIHLPISSQHRMKTPTWNWQSRLCLELIEPLPLGASFTLKSCKKTLRNHMYPSTHFPLITSEKDPIADYLSLLTDLQVLKQISSNIYVKTKALQFHHHVEAAVAQDMALMDRLIEKWKHDSNRDSYTIKE